MKDRLSQLVIFLAQCGSLSQCVLCIHEILGLLLYVMPLDCHRKVELASYMAPLNPATDIATKLSPNKYWSSRYFASADDLDTFVCFFDFHEIIEGQKKCNTQILISELSDNLLNLSRNKLSMSNCSRMAITILVLMIL